MSNLIENLIYGSIVLFIFSLIMLVNANKKPDSEEKKKLVITYSTMLGISCFVLLGLAAYWVFKVLKVDRDGYLRL